MDRRDAFAVLGRGTAARADIGTQSDSTLAKRTKRHRGGALDSRRFSVTYPDHACISVSHTKKTGRIGERPGQKTPSLGTRMVRGKYKACSPRLRNIDIQKSRYFLIDACGEIFASRVTSGDPAIGAP
ncbi:hypothetical protein [Burkholderia sp. Bp8986]|uniref:hypothetical protein n=1 Tax=Burkholderia sp. Bp8986 TaxID=2184550 RepID=UPI000F5B464D|nr:hypothetical protein [Burkholderia sp. Bp8986]